ncbi:hypothetical protein EVAR_82209_1 [Eumeta japonica]|uniref:Uncharacterized protein n=1 Tax=Eumeta variegata TaxID=151549 RepID=A0A4C1W5M8_EUMVA|nr:hypothetical protein EVAR_82209_1 [Eumeta japonica]
MEIMKPDLTEDIVQVDDETISTQESLFQASNDSLFQAEYATISTLFSMPIRLTLDRGDDPETDRDLSKVLMLVPCSSSQRCNT